MQKTLFILLGLVLLCSCEKTIEFVGSYEGEKIVLYACTSPELPLTANLHRSHFILGKDDGYYRDELSGADVRAYAGGREIILQEAARGEYVSDYVPLPGEEISIKAGREGYAGVSARTSVPHRADVRVTGVEVTDLANIGYMSQKQIRISFTVDDPAEERNFYRIQLLHGNDGDFDEHNDLYTKDMIFYRQSMGAEFIEDIIEPKSDIEVPEMFDDSMFDGQSHSFTVWTAVTLYSEALYYSDNSGDDRPEPVIPELNLSEYYLELDAVSQELYNYTKSVELYWSTHYGLGSLTGEPVSIYNNVKGGIGCFGAVAPQAIRLQRVQ